MSCVKIWQFKGQTTIKQQYNIVQMLGWYLLYQDYNGIILSILCILGEDILNNYDFNYHRSF